MIQPLVSDVSRRHLLQWLIAAGRSGPGARARPRGERVLPDGDWQPLFDGQSLGQWKPTEFGGEGVVKVEDGRIILAMGGDLHGRDVDRAGADGQL